MWQTAIQVLAVIGGGGLPVAVLTALVMRRKVRADADKTGADAAEVVATASAGWVKDVRADMDKMRELHQQEMQRVRAEVLALRRHVGALEGLLRVNGIPVPDLAWPPAGGA